MTAYRKQNFYKDTNKRIFRTYCFGVHTSMVKLNHKNKYLLVEVQGRKEKIQGDSPN